MLVGRPPRQGLGEAGHRSESSQHLVGDGLAAGRPRRRGSRKDGELHGFTKQKRIKHGGSLEKIMGLA